MKNSVKIQMHKLATRLERRGMKSYLSLFKMMERPVLHSSSLCAHVNEVQDNPPLSSFSLGQALFYQGSMAVAARLLRSVKETQGGSSKVA